MACRYLRKTVDSGRGPLKIARFLLVCGPLSVKVEQRLINCLG